LRELKDDEEAFRRNVEGSGIGLDKEGNEKSAHVEVV